MDPLASALDGLLTATRSAAAGGSFVETFAWITRHYRTHRLPGTDLAADGDMLLYQWGVYDWGDGLLATIDLTRQILVASDQPTEDPAIWQVHCCFRFPPPLLNQVKNGNFWCLHPREADGFSARMERSQAWSRLSSAAPVTSSLRLVRI
jgi:hypothetical protein